jgi:hypothetical protein
LQGFGSYEGIRFGPTFETGLTLRPTGSYEYVIIKKYARIGDTDAGRFHLRMEGVMRRAG